MKSEKIAILLPDLNGGGAEKISVNLANEMYRRGYIVDMVLMRAEGDFLSLLDPGINVVDFKAKRLRSGFIPLISYLHKVKPSAMLACMWPLTIMALAAKLVLRSKTRMVVAEHNTWSREQSTFSAVKRKLIPLSMRSLFPYADAIVAVSEGAAEDFADYTELPRKSITTIYNPIVEVEDMAHSAESELPDMIWSGARYRVLTVGNIKEQKNHDLLIRAFSILRLSIDAQLLILGEGPLRKDMERLITELNLQDCVNMPGFISNTKPIYRHAGVFVLSSDWEGLPTVLVEAMAVGTPVVSTDCPSGPREILDEGAIGSLVPMRDANALALAMMNALVNGQDVRALKNRAQDFSVKVATDKYLLLLLSEVTPEGCA